ncbi:hypothetical protein RvY_02841 [Ramazzottius varieornatus]|uniref:Uncharacterized protein n=1 Tax=Ramazzottius varieornatus TaxID=947166 RepID=A0A1D1UL47_RAMVA|nr:hypothetical protein RvY_02841 [Ramazzottius varieornatus]
MAPHVQSGVCDGSIHIYPKTMTVVAIEPHGHGIGKFSSKTSNGVTGSAKERMSKRTIQDVQLDAMSPTLDLPHVDREWSISILNVIPSLEEVRHAMSPGLPESEVDVGECLSVGPPTGVVQLSVAEDQRSKKTASRGQRFSFVGSQAVIGQASTPQNLKNERRKRIRKAKSRETTVLSCLECQRHVQVTDKATETAALSDKPISVGTSPTATVSHCAVPPSPPTDNGRELRISVVNSCRNLEDSLNNLAARLETESGDAMENCDFVVQSLTSLIAKAKEILDRQANPQAQNGIK